MLLAIIPTNYYKFVSIWFPRTFSDIQTFSVGQPGTFSLCKRTLTLGLENVTLTFTECSYLVPHDNVEETFCVCWDEVQENNFPRENRLMHNTLSARSFKITIEMQISINLVSCWLTSQVSHQQFLIYSNFCTFTTTEEREIRMFSVKRTGKIYVMLKHELQHLLSSVCVCACVCVCVCVWEIVYTCEPVPFCHAKFCQARQVV